MSDITDIEVKGEEVTAAVPEQQTPAEPDPNAKNVINYNPVFPTLTLVVNTDFDTVDMARDVYKTIGDRENMPGGYCSLFDGMNSKAVETLPKGEDLKGAIYQIALAYMRELKLEINPEKCSVRTWLNILRLNGYVHKPVTGPSQLTGVFVIQSDKTTSPVVLHNPTMRLRSHEALPSRPADFTAFTAPSMQLELEPGRLYMWPSWMEHEVPHMVKGGPLIFVTFTVDYLPPGV